MSEATDRKVVKWTMLGVLLVVLLHALHSVYSMGKIAQKVDDLSGRVARIEQWIDGHDRSKK
jgi:hypothetical protein